MPNILSRILGTRPSIATPPFLPPGTFDLGEQEELGSLDPSYQVPESSARTPVELAAEQVQTASIRPPSSLRRRILGGLMQAGSVMAGGFGVPPQLVQRWGQDVAYPGMAERQARAAQNLGLAQTLEESELARRKMAAAERENEEMARSREEQRRATEAYRERMDFDRDVGAYQQGVNQIRDNYGEPLTPPVSGTLPPPPSGWTQQTIFNPWTRGREHFNIPPRAVSEAARAQAEREGRVPSGSRESALSAIDALQNVDDAEKGNLRRVVSAAFDANRPEDAMRALTQAASREGSFNRRTEFWQDPSVVAGMAGVAGARAAATIAAQREALGGEQAAETYARRIERGDMNVTQVPVQLRYSTVSKVNTRILPPAESEKIKALTKAESDLARLFGLARKLEPLSGPIQRAKGLLNWAGAMAGTNPDAKALKDLSGAIVSNFARAIGGERGVLTDRDREYAKGLLADMFATREEINLKERNMQDFVRAAKAAIFLPANLQKQPYEEVLKIMESENLPTPIFQPPTSSQPSPLPPKPGSTKPSALPKLGDTFGGGRVVSIRQKKSQ